MWVMTSALRGEAVRRPENRPPLAIDPPPSGRRLLRAFSAGELGEWEKRRNGKWVGGCAGRPHPRALPVGCIPSGPPGRKSPDFFIFFRPTQRGLPPRTPPMTACGRRPT